MLPASSVTYSMQMWVLNPHAWALQFCRVLKPHELCHTRHCFYSNRAGKAWKQSCFAYKWINKQIILIKVHFWFKKTLMNSFYHFYKQSCIGFVFVFFFVLFLKTLLDLTDCCPFYIMKINFNQVEKVLSDSKCFRRHNRKQCRC